MYQLEQEMKHGKDEHVRTVSKVEYTLARYASFSSCWALTDYEDGWVDHNHRFYVVKSEKFYDDESESERWHRQVAEEKRMQRIIAKTVASIHDEETAAEVQYFLGNLQTIAKKYPNTDIGKLLSSHCDNWKDWI